MLCNTLVPNVGFKGIALGDKGTLVDEPFFQKTSTVYRSIEVPTTYHQLLPLQRRGQPTSPVEDVSSCVTILCERPAGIVMNFDF